MAITTREQIYNEQNGATFRPLIAEFALEPDKVVFTMNSEHKDGHISLYKLFIQFVVDDPTETVFAKEVFGDIKYWFTIREYTAMKTYVENWREICDVLRKQKAFEVMVDEVKSKGRNSFQAAKYLIEEPWKKGKTQRKSVAKTASKASPSISSELKEDLERIRYGQ